MAVMVADKEYLALYFVRRDDEGYDWYLACEPKAPLPAPVLLIRSDK